MQPFPKNVHYASIDLFAFRTELEEYKNYKPLKPLDKKIEDYYYEINHIIYIFRASAPKQEQKIGSLFLIENCYQVIIDDQSLIPRSFEGIYECLASPERLDVFLQKMSHITDQFINQKQFNKIEKNYLLGELAWLYKKLINIFFNSFEKIQNISEAQQQMFKKLFEKIKDLQKIHKKIINNIQKFEEIKISSTGEKILVNILQLRLIDLSFDKTQEYEQNRLFSIWEAIETNFNNTKKGQELWKPQKSKLKGFLKKQTNLFQVTLQILQANKEIQKNKAKHNVLKIWEQLECVQKNWYYYKLSRHLIQTDIKNETFRENTAIQSNLQKHFISEQYVRQFWNFIYKSNTEIKRFFIQMVHICKKRINGSQFQKYAKIIIQKVEDLKIIIRKHLRVFIHTFKHLKQLQNLSEFWIAENKMNQILKNETVQYQFEEAINLSKIKEILSERSIENCSINQKQHLKYIQCLLKQNLGILTQSAQEYILKNKIQYQNNFQMKFPFNLLEALLKIDTNIKENAKNNKQKKGQTQNIMLYNFEKIIKKIIYLESQSYQLEQLFSKKYFFQSWILFLKTKIQKDETSVMQRIYNFYVTNKGEVISNSSHINEQKCRFLRNQLCEGNHIISSQELKQILLCLHSASSISERNVESNIVKIDYKQQKLEDEEFLKKYVSYESFRKDEEQYHRYVLKLHKHPYFKDSHDHLSQIKDAFEAVKLAKCFNNQATILSIKIHQNLVYINLKDPRPEEFQSLQKTLLKAVRRFTRITNSKEKELQATFPYWHSYLNEKTFKIIKNPQADQFSLVINPYEALLTSLLFGKYELEKKYLEEKYPNNPFIDFANIISKLKSNTWFYGNCKRCGKCEKCDQPNQCQQYEFDHMIKEMRALALEDEQFKQKPLKKIQQIPYFWSAERRVVEIITFKENYQSQIGFEESRRKKNEKNKSFLMKQKSKLQIQLSGLTNSKDKQKIKKIQETLLEVEQKLVEFNPTDQRKREYERQLVEGNNKNFKKPSNYSEMYRNFNFENLIPYQYANNLNKATQGYYSIEGVIEKAAFDDNIGNFVKSKKQDRYLYGVYQWSKDKPKIKQMIMQVVEKEEKKILDDHQKNKGNNEGDGYYKITYPSFQTHLRFLRNICAHLVRDKRGKIEKQMNYEQKIKVIQKNFPRVLVFLYKWKSFVGKPISVKDESEQSNEKNNKKSSNKYEIQKSKQDEEQSDIIEVINKTLTALFPFRGPTNLDRAEKLKKIIGIQKYNVNAQEIFGYIIPTGSDRKSLCDACLILSNSLRNNKEFWNFLNDLNSRKNQENKYARQYNVLFYQHWNFLRKNRETKNQTKSKTSCICLWSQKNEILYAYFNMMKRKNLKPEELDLIESEYFLQMIEEEKLNKKKSVEEKAKGKGSSESDNDFGHVNVSVNEKITGNKTRNQFEAEIRREGRKDLLQDALWSTDYIGRMFIFELQTQFPNLLDDIRHTRYLWDENVTRKVSIEKDW